MTKDRKGSRSCAAGMAALAFVLGLCTCNAQLGASGDEADGDDLAAADLGLTDAELAEGKRLYDAETFGGNGRTCLTCHSRKTGTLSPEEAQIVFAANPQDPLFLHDGSDDFNGSGTTRIRDDATILVRRNLPQNVEISGDAATRSIVVHRGIPSTLNTPALDTVLMLDGRGSTLTAQANGAIRGHAQAPAAPTDAQLDLIAGFEKTTRFFSSSALRDYAEGGSPPELPQGYTPAQRRGRLWFEDAPVGPALTSASPRRGLCALCHSGPMLNQTNAFLAALPQGIAAPAGTRFASVLVSELNDAQNPVFNLIIRNSDGTTRQVSTPDPGRSLVTNTWVTTPFGLRADFKIPPLWGIKKTAPYFHDNSSRTLADVIEHYATFYSMVTDVAIDGDAPLIMTLQDRADLIAYMKLL